MFYITGDMHRNIGRLYALKETANANDTLIVLGDAGINYCGDERDTQLKTKISQLPFNLFCIHGNHENRPQNISTYTKKMWNGGEVYVEEQFPNIIFAVDGEIYNLDGISTLVIGGAYSVDKDYRISNGRIWFEDEQPSEDVKKCVMQKLYSVDNYVDCILSHTCPIKYMPKEAFLPFIDQSKVDHSTEEWLDEVRKVAHYRKWFCGHYHIEKIDKKIEFLYENIKQFRV